MGPAKALIFSAALLAGAGVLAAQEMSADAVRIYSAPYRRPEATIAVDTNLVELAVTVRDRSGKLIADLQKSDFALLDNSKPQGITFFSEQRATQPAAQTPGAPGPITPTNSPAAEPRSIALFFDDTHSGMAGFDRSRKAAEKLIGDGLRPGDRVGIFTGSGAVTLDFTADTNLLLATLAGMRRHPDSASRNGFGACPTLTPYQAYVIANHLDLLAKDVAAADIKGCSPEIPWELALQQAQTSAENAWVPLKFQSSDVLGALMAVARHLASAQGTRILLMVSPGFVTGGMEQQTGAFIDTCLRGHIVVNGLDDEGLLGNGAESPESLGAIAGPRAAWAGKTMMLRGQIVTELLADAATSTGGQFIHNNNDLAGALRSLAAPPEVSYLLGFSPTEKPDGKYHKLKLTTTRSGGYQVSARPGYVSTVQTPPSETAQQHIDRVVASGESLHQVPAIVKVSAAADKQDRYRIQVDIALDARRLPFGKQSGKSIQQLTFVTVLEDASGTYIEGKQAIMDLALTTANRAALEAKGIKANTSFLAPKGAYRVREVIREAVHNQLAASNSPIEIR